MIYDDLKINTKNWKHILSAFNNKKLSHALLFHGPEGSGKEAHAIELAGLINCLYPTEYGACGLCSGCQKLKTAQHSHIHFVTPLPRDKTISKHSDSLSAVSKKNQELLRELLETKVRHPYSKAVLPNSNTILINSIRELRREVYLTKTDFGWRTIIVFDAEKLCIPQPHSANALLKLLEEPPENTIFILVTSNISIILDTIKSRCQQVYFPELNPSSIEEILVNDNIDSKMARIIAKLSAGNVHKAIRIAKNTGAINTEIDLILESIFEPNSAIWKKFIDNLSNLKRKSGNDLDYFMDLILYVFRDLLVISKTRDSEQVLFKEYYEKLLSYCIRFPNADWESIIQLIEDTILYIKANGYLPLMIQSMLIDMRTLLKGQSVDKFTLEI
jgi:DNA polymerase III subunit delta'